MFCSEEEVVVETAEENPVKVKIVVEGGGEGGESESLNLLISTHPLEGYTHVEYLENVVGTLLFRLEEKEV